MLQFIKNESGNSGIFIVLHFVVKVEMSEEVIHRALTVHQPSVISVSCNNIRIRVVLVVYRAYKSFKDILESDDTAA